MEKQKRARKEPEETPDERLARGKAIREEVRENREAMKRMSTRSGTLTQEKKRKKKEPAVALRQSTLQEFFSHSNTFMERVAETARQRHEAKAKKPEPFVQHCCGTCGHHKGRKTFHDSCPRLGELLFKGGTKSAKVLMDETAATPCGYWTDIPGDLYVPEKIQDCFGKLCDQITGTAGCENCADHEACHKEPARLKRSVKK
jgi:hypothetical protein